jgi:ribosomal protein S12 methylthiotransferase accessory factor
MNSDIKHIYNELKRRNVLGEFRLLPVPEDEPSFYIYKCERKSPHPYIKSGYGYGTSNIKEQAFLAAVFEAIERYCILEENEEQYIKGSYNDFKGYAVDPFIFEAFSEEQLKKIEYKKFIFNHDTKFNWIKAKSLTDNKEVLVPAQLVYAEYHSDAKEPLIRIPISTGASASLNYDDAIYRGICEIIERDNYMISYLNKIAPPILDLKLNPELNFISDEFTKKGVELYCLNVSLDFSATSIVSIIIDRSGRGPAVTLGLGCDLDPAVAVKKSIFEAAGIRISSKNFFFKHESAKVYIDNSSELNLLRKKYFWMSLVGIKQLKFFISGEKKSLNSLKNNFKNNLLNELVEKNYHVYLIDVTVPDVKETGLSVVKVLIPELYPLYRNERFPYLKNKRLFQLPIDLKMTDKILDEKELFLYHPL